MTPDYRWPLAVSPFTLWDRLGIAAWVATNDRFTMGRKVDELEAKFAEMTKRWSLMVSSGSTANQLVFELWKVKNPAAAPPVVVCPAVTWISSISPAMMAGMEIAFCDVNLIDLSFDYGMLERLLTGELANRRVIIWPTALIGFSPDMPKLHELAARHGAAEVYLDACEHTLGLFEDDTSIMASADITTTSMYLSHYICSVEGGMVCFKDEADYALARMFRNHGMTRSLPADHQLRRRFEVQHKEVDPQFLFAMAGTNLRPSDVHAAFGLADIKRAAQGAAQRVQLYAQFQLLLDPEKYYLPPPQRSHVPFCLPILVRDTAKLAQVKSALAGLKIERRPIIGGCLPGLQPPFKQYGPVERYPNALWLHRNGTYVGLHREVTPKMVRHLTNTLNEL